MNQHQQAQLMKTIRGRVEMFHSNTGTERGFRVSNSTDTHTDVYVYDYIGGWDGVLAKDVVGALAQINGHVNLHINSGGGDIFEGVAIYNAFKNHTGGVTAYVDGVAASAASFIAMAAEKVIIEANATMMIHDGMALCMGNEQELADASALVGKLSDTIAEMYAGKAGGEAKDWRKKMRAETWYNADEAVMDGLADEVNGAASGTTNKLDLAIFNYTGQATQPAPQKLAPAASLVTAPPLDMDGLRNALKGAFA